MLVDSHCHLDMLEHLEMVLERMRAAGVERAVTIGVDAASSEWAVEAATRAPGVYATIGLHPHDARDRTDAVMDRFAELALRDRVVAIGEAGLDYHYDNSPREQQRSVFAEHVRLANACGKALVIHTRDAWDDTFRILESEGVPERVIFHCFSGGPEEAERSLILGAILSFSGVITFKNAGVLRDVVSSTPIDRILLETDAPFLTPVPHRGKTNEPARVVHVADAVAQLKDLSLDEVARVTSATSARVFGWD